MTSLRSIALSLIFGSLLPAQTLPAIYDNYRVLSVSGDADIRVAPNLVLLSLGVETRETQLRPARVQNDSAVQHIIQALGTLGVKPEDIKTDFMNVNIQFNNIAPNTIDSYSVEKAIGVTIRDVAAFDHILGAVLDAGANRIYGVEFRTTDLRKYRDQARAAAVKAAVDKASALAADAGIQLDSRPLGLSNYTDGGGSWFGGSRCGMPNGNNQFQSQNISQIAGGSGTQGSIAPGQISVTASVTMSFLRR